MRINIETMDRCVNCRIATGQCNALGRRLLDNEKFLSVARRWLAPQSVTSSDCICQACWDLAKNSQADDQVRPLGHRHVCLRCGCSLASKVKHLIHTNSTREENIYNVIQDWIAPLTIQATSYICHKCWVTTDRAAARMNLQVIKLTHQCASQNEGAVTQQALQLTDQRVCQNAGVIRKQAEPTIVLSEYMRPIETESKCFINGCQRKDRNRIPLPTRKLLFNLFKYYVPENNRLCNQHLDINSCDFQFVDILRSNVVQTFTDKHIYDLMSLKEVVDPSPLQNEMKTDE